MRNPLTAAIPAVIVALAACSGDSITGPGYSNLRDPKGTPSTPTTTEPTTSSASSPTSRLADSTGSSSASAASGATAGATTTYSYAAGVSMSGSSQGTGGTSSSTTGSTSGSSANGGGSGVSSQLTVAGSFQVVVPGTDVIVGFRASPQPAQAGGICGRDDAGQPNGSWIKTTSGTTSTHLLHAHCTIRQTTSEQTITVTVAESATYVQSPNGNLALNFASACPAGVSDPSCADRFVHYRANGDVTAGSGLLTAAGSDGSVWTIDLSQIAHSSTVRLATADGIAPALRAYTALVATSATDLTTSAARFAW